MHNKSAFGSASFRVAVPALFLVGAATAQADFITSENTVPSVDSIYSKILRESPTLYAAGALQVVVTNFDWRPLHNGATPPDQGQFRPSFFDVFAEFDMSISGGPVSHVGSIQPSPGHITLLCLSGGGGLGTFQTEMLSLDINCGNGVMIRESPTLQSTGQTKVTAAPADGQYHIDSFFDVFTELSIDGGASWMPSASGPDQMVASQGTPEPSTIAAIGLGLVVLVRKRKK